MRRGTRRDFLKKGTLATAGFWTGSSLLADHHLEANSKLNVGVIGAGGKGTSDAAASANENIVALCDVDLERAKKTIERFPKAKLYRDYRQMLDKEKLDAVTVSTPDHHHAPAALRAMRMGKHVYVQKPLTYTIQEARMMRETAAKMGLATQMGNQGTASSGLRRGAELVQSGAIGDVTEIHVWTNRPVWPQGVGRPKGSQPIPKHLDWDLWLGPAPKRPYHSGYCPFSWRGWVDYGTGALGDMACHTMNLPFMACKLGYPTAAEASSSGFNGETWPSRSKIRFDFPARGNMPALIMYWYDGGELPPKEYTDQMLLPEGGRIPKNKKNLTGKMSLPSSGSFMVGTKGILYSPNDYGTRHFLLPQEKFESYEGPAPWLPRNPEPYGAAHHAEWLRACKGGPKAMSNFDYSGLLTESMLLGNVAMRYGHRIDWDGEAMKVTNSKSANYLIGREYRKGWDIDMA